MIRYDSSYNKEINRVVSNFNRKVRRLEREERELLPSPVSVRDIKERFDNRRDLNTYLNELKRFSKRGAEEIVTVHDQQFTRFDIEIFRLRLRRERSKLDRDIREAEAITSRYPMQHDISTQNLRNRRLRVGESWKNLITTRIAQDLENRTRNLETYNNYLEIMFQDAYIMGYDDEKINYIKEKLLKLSPSKFIRALEDSPEIQFIFDYYHSLTRQNGISETRGRKAYDQLYKRIDEIVKTYN